jgi:GH24 family phage-related lysozyme (muramidase)
MTSAVNVNGKDTLAKNYVMLGGVLVNNKLRYGVGGADKAYSNFSPSLSSYNNSTLKAGTAGIKPMPGIESIDIKSKSAYGSLREVVVNFKCHNLQQLEDLELLYMRPGYTVLIEWGWTPYLDKGGKLKNSIKFYDGVLDGNKTREEVWSELYQLSKEQEHNYDALYGYVKNYNWTARMDGGYDCQTTIISIGEIMESLKVNYLPYDVSNIIKSKGLLGLMTQDTSTLPFNTIPEAEAYSKNILAGLLQEIYSNASNPILQSSNPTFPKLQISGSAANLVELPKTYDYNLFKLDYKTNPLPNTLASTGAQIYITLGSFIDLLNRYVLLYAGKNSATSTPLVSLSAKSNKYDDNGESLLCLAHPLQISIDPTVCLVTNPLWAKGVNFKGVDKGAENGAPTLYDTQAEEIFKLIQTAGPAQQDPIGQKLIDTISYGKAGYNLQNAKEFVRSFYFVVKKKFPNYTTQSILNLLKKIDDNVDQIKENTDTYKNLFTLTNFTAAEEEDKAKKAAVVEAAKVASGAYSVEYLVDLSKGGYSFENKNETGIIENIYLNVDFLYRLSIEPNLQTKNQELKLYDYLKSMLKEVQESIGGVNNFEIHVDPIDNVARIIDLNYVDLLSKKDAYSKAFTIESQNLSGTVRSYNLQSKIFPEQGSMIAIGAQVKGGNTQGTSASTLLDFNNALEDRIIPKKIDPPLSNSSQLVDSVVAKYEKLKVNINKIKEFFFEEPKQPTDSTEAVHDQGKTSEYKSALKDLITYFQNVITSNTNGRSIIPVQVSLTMDGIGGLVIGHLFKIPPDLLPKGYGSDSVGGKLIQTITGISHKVAGGDWTTTIDALNIVTNDSSEGTDMASFNDLITESQSTFNIVVPGPVVDINLSGTYSQRAYTIIASFEGFWPVAKWDVNHYRGGYGSDKKLVNNNLVEVTSTTTFTQQEAKDTLLREITGKYGPKALKQIGNDAWNALNDNQRAAITSYVYNVGSLRDGIVSAIKAKNYQTAAAEIQKGPTTAGGKTLAGLVTRRATESKIFLTP